MGGLDGKRDWREGQSFGFHSGLPPPALTLRVSGLRLARPEPSPGARRTLGEEVRTHSPTRAESYIRALISIHPLPGLSKRFPILSNTSHSLTPPKACRTSLTSGFDSIRYVRLYASFFFAIFLAAAQTFRRSFAGSVGFFFFFFFFFPSVVSTLPVQASKSIQTSPHMVTPLQISAAGCGRWRCAARSPARQKRDRQTQTAREARQREKETEQTRRDKTRGNPALMTPRHVARLRVPPPSQTSQSG